MTPSEAKIFAALGQMIVEWNHAEERVRTLMMNLVGWDSHRGILRARILTVELGSVSLSHALRSFANNILGEDVGKYVLHAAEYYDRLRAYRNYYTHAIDHVSPGKSGPRGLASTVTSKGELKRSRDIISIEEIYLVTQRCSVLGSYCNRISVYRSWPEEYGDTDLPRPPLPDMPRLPDRLQKRVEHLRLMFPPPEEAQE